MNLTTLSYLSPGQLPSTRRGVLRELEIRNHFLQSLESRKEETRRRVAELQACLDRLESR